MKKLAFFSAVSAVILASCGTPQLSNIVDVEGGQIEGYIQDSLKIFKGIPFAAPPVGDLRW
ncbi:MAG: carboxylesterase family protein, partial [Bacteroidales bacterium]|nr:carboxylesterase family protein [Bacteroidales bacterium]